MRILFIYSCLPLGGIETFMIRLVRSLKSNNIEVSILFFSNSFDENLLLELKELAKIYYWEDYTYAPKFLKILPPILKLLFPIKTSKLKNELINNITHIHAPDTYSIFFSLRLKAFGIPITTGVYHINEYNIRRFEKKYFGKKIINIIENLTSNNVLFFNEISRELYAHVFNKSFSKSLVAPIGVDLDKYDGNFSGKQNNRIVSIGRLALWKTYNQSMITVIKNLNTRNIFVRYESYGDGEQRSELESLVKKENLQDQVFFFSGVSYDLFKNTIHDSLMFIGAGTALIEASACGIPSLIGIENQAKAISYGFLHETNSYSYQENELNYKTDKIENFIERLISLSKDDYMHECVKARVRAADFTITKTRSIFINMLENSIVVKNEMKWIHYFLLFFSLCIHLVNVKMTNSYKQSFFNRL